LAPLAASVANGEWELLFGMVPIIVLYKSKETHPQPLQGGEQLGLKPTHNHYKYPLQAGSFAKFAYQATF
jgi:hypothetical protein